MVKNPTEVCCIQPDKGLKEDRSTGVYWRADNWKTIQTDGHRVSIAVPKYFANFLEDFLNIKCLILIILKLLFNFWMHIRNPIWQWIFFGPLNIFGKISKRGSRIEIFSFRTIIPRVFVFGFPPIHKLFRKFFPIF